jgi:SAM-dependent methyltransferase
MNTVGHSGGDASPAARLSPAEWSARWAPYDAGTYRDALAYLEPGWTVLDIGAGDLRFARQAAALGCRVIAIERQPDVLARGLRDQLEPDGISIICVDARRWPFPEGLDAAVLLMRHCVDYMLYVEKLRAVGCPALITNARWGLGVERVPLAVAPPYQPQQMGWYACVRCGNTGFTPGDPDDLTPSIANVIHNVEGCPMCRPTADSRDSRRPAQPSKGRHDRNRDRLS